MQGLELLVQLQAQDGDRGLGPLHLRRGAEDGVLRPVLRVFRLRLDDLRGLLFVAYPVDGLSHQVGPGWAVVEHG